MYLQSLTLSQKYPWIKADSKQVPDGSSVDESRVIRFDYRDAFYAKLAKEAYDLWLSDPQYKNGTFFPTPNVFTARKPYGRSHLNKCTAALDGLGVYTEPLPGKEAIQNVSPLLFGDKPESDLYGYLNRSSGWADAQKAITGLRDQCIEGGVSFICGARGTVVAFDKDEMSGNIIAVKTASGHDIQADYFILAAGAWSSKLAPFYNSTIAAAQVLAFIKLTPQEIIDFKDLPLFIDYDSGWFCFPPHEGTGHLKIAVHGWGYTRTTDEDHQSVPPTAVRSRRTNFAPDDGVGRLRAGLKIVIPKLAHREFERVAVCWYNDTPSGDFIVDYHPDHPNLFLATGGSGQ